MSALYVVATPIGNLEDISLRALRILGEVSLIAAEDTRKTRRLLARYGIKARMTSYHEHSKWTKLGNILTHLAEGDVALVSEAGMPGISDPGYELITTCWQRGIRVIPIPGPSAIITALAISGLPTDKFIYLGFLPHKTGSRRRLLQSLTTQTVTILAFESPHRLVEALKDILDTLGDRRIAVCRELTKIYEEVFRGTVSQALERFTQPRGEFTLVIEGRGDKEKPQLTEDVQRRLNSMRRSGLSAKEAIAELTVETGLSRRELYRLWLRQVGH